MKPTILLTGKSGQVGSELLQLLPGIGRVVAPDRQALDLLDSDNLRRTVRDVRPQLIVNTAAYTAVDQAETEEARARAVNSEAPEVLAQEAKKIGAALVHYSTDYVFDGSKRSPYEETDLPNPLNVYGKTKLAGEEAIRRAEIPHFLFRTSWVYGTRGRNFLLTILRLASEREELKVVCDQVGAPTYAKEIAMATMKVLTRVGEHGRFADGLAEATGTYHMTAAGQTTWFEFAKAILEKARSTSHTVPWFVASTHGRALVVRRIIPISTKEYPTAAQRPAFSVLSNSRFVETFGLELPHWSAQLHRCFAFEKPEGLSAEC